jgi:UDP-3-O-[3-hydroxymyristoyl] glucosamine N-acyltransferase
VGIAGSTELGRQVMVGGQAGLSGHLKIDDGAMIAARAGVGRDIAAGQAVSGTPAIDHATFLRAQGVFARLPEMRRGFKEMERRLRELGDREPSGDAGGDTSGDDV